MTESILSDELRQFFREELREDGNATLATAQIHLAELCEAAPSDSIAAQERSLAELTELLNVYHGHTPLSDLLSRP